MVYFSVLQLNNLFNLNAGKGLLVMLVLQYMRRIVNINSHDFVTRMNEDEYGHDFMYYEL